AGLERRWSRFALQLELRAVGVKAHDVGDMPVAGTVTVDTGNMTTPDAPQPLPPTTTSANDGMAGGQIVLSGNYYF
ncbi:MAG TPA: hypothetical protein VIV40_22125, partial [Kofleriaceae bacterium]